MVNLETNIPELCQQALYNGEMRAKVEFDIHIAFEWAKSEDRFDDAIRRVSVLSEEGEFFRALIFLWIASTRKDSLQEVKQENCESILRIIEEKIPTEIRIMELGKMEKFPSILSCIIDRVQKFTKNIEILTNLKEDIETKEFDFERLTVHSAWSYEIDKRFTEFEIRELEGSYQLATQYNRELELQNHSFQKAILLAKEIKEGDFEKLRALSGIVRNLFKDGKLKDAKTVLDIAVREITSDESLYLLADNLHSIAQDCIEAKEIEKIKITFQAFIKIFRKMKEAFWKEKALQQIASVMIKTGLVEIAYKLTQEIEDAGLLNSEIQQQIAILFVKTGKIEKAIQCYKEITESSGRQIAFQSISKSIIQKGQLEEILLIANEIRDEDERLNAWLYITEALVKVSKIEKAQEVFAKYVTTFKGIEDPYFHSDSLIIIIKELTKTGKLEQALELKNTLRDLPHKTTGLRDLAEAYALLSIAKSLVEIDDIPKSEAVLEEVIGLVKNVKDYRDRANILEDLAEVLAEKHKLTNREKLFNDSLDLVKPIEYQTNMSSVLNSIAKALAQSRDLRDKKALFQKTIKIAREVLRRYDKQITFRYIAVSLARSGMIKTAISLSKEIQEYHKKFYALISIAESLAKAGNTVSAKQIFERLITDIERVDYDKQSKVLEELAVSLVRSGDTENAIRVFRMTMEILKRNKLSNFKAERFVSIASSMLKLGEAKISRIVLEEAISFVEKPEFYTEELEPSTIASIAEVFSILNELERAKQVFLKALEIADEGFLYFGITRYLVKSHSNLWHIFPEWLQKKRSSMDYGSIKRVTQTWIHSLSFLKSYFFKDEEMDSETQKQNAEQALPYLVDALNYLPNDYETAFMGVRAITINLARQQSWDILREVVKACPQLGLEIINS